MLFHKGVLRIFNDENNSMVTIDAGGIHKSTTFEQ